MDFREPLLGVPNVLRKKSDHPILSLISPRPTLSPRAIDPFSTSHFDQGRGGSEFQVGCVPGRRFPTPEATPSSAASSFLGHSRLSTQDLLVAGSLQCIPEEPHHGRNYSCSGTAKGRGNDSDLEASSSSVEERNGYDYESSDRGAFGEPLTDDAQEAKEDKDFSWTSGLAGLLLSVPLLPSLPDVLNPFSRSPDDDDFFPRCDPCKQCHGADYLPPDEQNATITPKRPGGMRELFYSSLPARHSLPDLLSPSGDEHSLCEGVPVLSPRGPAKVFSIKEHAEALAPYAPVTSSGLLHHDGGKAVKKILRRCKTAPILTGIVGFHTKPSEDKSKYTEAPKKSASSVVWHATMGLCLYLCLGVVIYTWKKEEFSGIETVGVIDALYFCIVTMCTIGYGDIIPITPSAKILACALVVVGFGFIDALMSGMVTFVLDRQEHLLLSVMEDGHHERAKSVVIDAKKGRMRIRMKVALAVGTVLCAMTIGAVVLHYMENLSWIDALYATCISITTVGYGDVSFQTSSGRLFAAVWLLFSTLGVARAFLYLAEARVHSRHRHLAKRVLQRKMTTNDLMAMDLDNDGHVRSEFVVYKLKEMGKIDENDITEICKQFENIDSMNAGKITLAQLLEGDG